MAIYSSSNYQLIVLSKNYFLWVGLKNSVQFMVNPYPDIQWFNENKENSIFKLREKITADNSGTKWLVITEHYRTEEVQQFLPPERVCVLSDKLSLRQLSTSLKCPEFQRRRQKNVPLTHSEIHICLLIIMGYSINTIASMLNKSPKTIYTHRRNAMVKFDCNTLAGLHRKMSTIENCSRY
ncbi:helix-turn-helix transcriptional regulator [Kluyvera sp. STS39-E]|uniref:helix-turn-helix transcriptional regulator n=1 Tax=Kluyvera sp. STS39-E TaxID=3234748 RepID=UPI0034C5BC00